MKHTLTMTVAALAFAAPVAGQGVMITQPGQPQAALEKTTRRGGAGRPWSRGLLPARRIQRTPSPNRCRC